MKYVILIEEVSGDVARTHHLIFPEYMTHVVVGLSYQLGFKAIEKRELSLKSGGFCELDAAGHDWVCEHGSESMKLPKDPAMDSVDATILNRAEAFNGLVY